MRACGPKLVKFCTHTHAAKLVVAISMLELLNDALPESVLRAFLPPKS